MKEIKVEVTTYKTEYEAADGTRFESEYECKKYENSAALVLLSRLNIIKDHYNISQNFEFIDICDENTYCVVVLRDEKDIMTINQLSHLFGKPIVFTKKDIDKPILIGRYLAGDLSIDNLWFYRLESVVNDLTDGVYTVSKVR